MRGRPSDVLRSVRELERFRVTTGEGGLCGRFKDVYFDDHTWKLSHLVLSIEPRPSAQKQVLVRPEQVGRIWDEVQLTLSREELEESPLASSVLPVCKQYASLALASPGAGIFAKGMVGSDPHLRSARAVTNYRIHADGEFAGVLADLVFDDVEWELRYLKVEQIVERKRVQFYVTPQSVERFAWATQRVTLRSLNPVELVAAEGMIVAQAAA